MKRIGALMLSIVILCVASFPVSAEKSVGELQSDLSNLNKELQTLERSGLISKLVASRCLERQWRGCNQD